MTSAAARWNAAIFSGGRRSRNSLNQLENNWL
jgi:hypothetical protein